MRRGYPHVPPEHEPRGSAGCWITAVKRCRSRDEQDSGHRGASCEIQRAAPAGARAISHDVHDYATFASGKIR